MTRRQIVDVNGLNVLEKAETKQRVIAEAAGSQLSVQCVRHIEQVQGWPRDCLSEN